MAGSTDRGTSAARRKGGGVFRGVRRKREERLKGVV